MRVVCMVCALCMVHAVQYCAECNPPSLPFPSRCRDRDKPTPAAEDGEGAGAGAGAASPGRDDGASDGAGSLNGSNGSPNRHKSGRSRALESRQRSGTVASPNGSNLIGAGPLSSATQSVVSSGVSGAGLTGAGASAGVGGGYMCDLSVPHLQLPPFYCQDTAPAQVRGCVGAWVQSSDMLGLGYILWFVC